MSPAQIQKQQFRNQTDGWIGATVIGPRGEDRGVAIEPHGTVWLSEDEQVLTANAPRRPADNPFIEQVHLRTNPETGEQEEVKVTPLVPVSEERFVPAQARFVPGVDAARDTAIAQQAATGDQPTVPTVVDGGALQRHVEVRAQGDKAIPNHRPPVAAPGTPLDGDDDDAEVPEPPQEPQQPPQEPQEPPVPYQQTDDEFQGQGGEETAAKVDQRVGEETGAAPPPTGDAPEGEYAQAEEVGTPVERSTEPSTSSPPPYSPPKE